MLNSKQLVKCPWAVYDRNMWKKEYKQKKYYWGLKPNPTLQKYIDKIPKGIVLDIGAGEGRNSIFLAKNKFKVEAIDKVKEGLEKIQKLAEINNLSIKTQNCDVKSFKFEKNKYSLVLSFASIDFLKKREIDEIIKKIKESLIVNGFIYLLVFSTKDPMYTSIIRKGIKQIEKNTFYLPKHKTYKHFFDKKEIQNKFSDFNIILLKQKTTLDTGRDKPHYHNIIELLAQKKKALG